MLAHRFDAPAGSILLLHNLADTKVTVDIGPLPGMDGDSVRPVRRRPVRRADQEAHRPGAERLGISMDPAVSERSRLTEGLVEGADARCANGCVIMDC